MLKIGLGFDAHPLKIGRKLWLGGIEIAFEKGLDGHSDADVLLHAIIDALLGAIGEGDIGFFFPASDETWRDASSISMLEKVGRIVRDRKFAIVNIDAIIIAERPSLHEHFEAMKVSISRALHIEGRFISIKGKRTEGLGYTGREEGIAAQAVALLEKE